MKYLALILLMAIVGTYFLWPGTKELEPYEFEKALKNKHEKILIDLRSSRDFSKGHISGATNIDSGWPTYNWRIIELDTNLQVFLYCQNGERSANAAISMKSQGFKFVTVLKGGLKNWIYERYEVTPPELVPPAELTFKDFSRILDLEHLVIVFFYLPGDKKCRKTEHILDELAIEHRGRLKILRIDGDKYKYLTAEMGIEEVPTWQLYENGNLCETIEGVFGKDRIEGEFGLREYVTTMQHTEKQLQ